MLAKGVAHISFVGGGLFLPARTPYDREVVADYVADRVRSKGIIQVIIDERRWTVQRHPRRAENHCLSCGQGLDAACTLAGWSDIVACIRCALGDGEGNSAAVAHAA